MEVIFIALLDRMEDNKINLVEMEEINNNSLVDLEITMEIILIKDMEIALVMSLGGTFKKIKMVQEVEVEEDKVIEIQENIINIMDITDLFNY